MEYVWSVHVDFYAISQLGIAVPTYVVSGLDYPYSFSSIFELTS
jgi:hypothetical protein